MYIIVFIIILGILVFVHELGHFLAAKRSGVKVEEFGFGFPPRIFGIKRGETVYSINLFPIGGFVKLYGEEYHETVSEKGIGHRDKKKIDPDIPDKDRTFVYKKPWQKAFIIVAGVIGNFLLGWFVISYLFTQGVPTPTNKVLIEQIQSHSPAQAAGIKARDLVTAIRVDGKDYPVTSTNDMMALTSKYAGKEIEMILERDKKPMTIEIVPRANPPKGQGSLGVVISTPFTEKKYPWYQAPFYGLLHAFTITQKIVTELTKTVINLITFQKVQVDVAGPIGIAQYTGTALKFGTNAVLELMALLSLNLAVINILPFPALDGGRLVFIVYEWITKKRVNEKFEQKLNLVGFALLLTLAALVTIHDIIKIYK